jgi:acyl-CoA thioesterase FadM
MIAINENLSSFKDGIFEMIMPIEYPDFDTQGIMNNANIATMIETACEEFLEFNGYEKSLFSKKIINYKVIFKRGIALRFNTEKQYFEPIIPKIRLIWKEGKNIIIDVFDSENSANVFVNADITLNWDDKTRPKPKQLTLPLNSRVLKFSMINRSNNINRFGYYHLGRIATFLENSHLWFFGEGYLKTTWIKTPLPIIVKSIDLTYFKSLYNDKNLVSLLRVESADGKSSVRFVIDIVDKDNEEDILARANLVAVYVHPDPTDWTSAYKEIIPEQLRNRIISFHNG